MSDDASTQDPGDAAGDRQDCRQARHAEACALVKRQIMRKLGRLPYMLGDHIDLLNLEQVRELSLAVLEFNCVGFQQHPPDAWRLPLPTT